MAYLEELRGQGVCKTSPSKNQHGHGQIEICEAFWPYERQPPQQKPQSLAEYTAHTRRLLAGRACVKITFSPADEKLAVAYFERQVPIEIIEQGILMACTRKYMTLLSTAVGFGPICVTNRRPGRLIVQQRVPGRPSCSLRDPKASEHGNFGNIQDEGKYRCRNKYSYYKRYGQRTHRDSASCQR